MGWIYRIRQFVAHLTAREPAIGRECVQATLQGPLLDLFAQLSWADQQHAVRVLETLSATGPISTELAQAALLHDVGKAGAHLTLIHRTIVVLAEALLPGQLQRLAAPNPQSWRYAFYRQLRHAELGAERCLEAGCSDDVATLVRYHESTDLPDGLANELANQLRALKRADDLC